MSTRLLAMKLNVPPVPATLTSRARLLRLLDESMKRKLTLISAPAGFGKTTLLSEWITASDPSRLPVAWITLDERDNDPRRFWAYVLAALAKLDVRSDEDLLAPKLPQSLFEDLLTALIDTISAGTPNDFALILDDYHVITDDSVHAATAFLLEHMPPQMHIIVASRSEPPLPLARLRLADQLMELHADDLRFTLDETVDFLNQAMDFRLPIGHIETLDAKTEGWIAGLKLVALSMRNRRDVAEFVQNFAGTHHYVFDYLAEQVLLQQPPVIQEFLLATSILERLTGHLCDAVTGLTGGQATLQRLDHANLFLVPLDDHQRWYRYHHLFSDFLKERLRRTAPDRWIELHRRAAGWFERHESMEEAVTHALAAEDFQTAVRLIVHVAAQLWYRSDNLTLLSWMKSVPEPLILSNPFLCTSYATTLAVVGQLDAVEALLRTAEAHVLRSPHALLEVPYADSGVPASGLRSPFSTSWRTPQALLTHNDSLRAFVARFRNPGEAITFSQRALARIPPAYQGERGLALLYQGHAHLLKGDMESAQRLLVESSGMCRSAGNVSGHLSAIHYLAQMYVLQGRLRQAAAICQDAIQYVSQQKQPLVIGIEQVGLGDVLREWNELEAAAQRIDEGMRWAERGGDFVFLRDAYLARARLECALGDFNAASTFIDKAEQVARGSAAREVEAQRARVWMAQGRLAAAQHWAESSGLTVEDELSFLDELPHLTFARFLLACGEPVQAARFVARLLPAAESAGRMGRAIEILILQSLAAQALGETPQAFASLKRALALAEPEGYVRAFVDEGAPVADVLEQVSRSGDGLAEYARKLLAILAEQKGRERDRPPGWPLTGRESDILRLIAAGKSYHAIAQELTIAVGTVQSHIKNIYQKLDAHSGLEAVAQARRLGLIP